jgi:hypothetical protein
MPRFYNQYDPDLSDLNRAKKSVNRDYAKQYQSQDGNHDNLGQTADKDAKFNALSTRLTNLYTSLIDFGQALNAPVAILINPIASFRPAQVGQLQQLSSRILSEVRAVNTIFSSLKSFDIFTPPEAQQLQQSVQEINDAQGLIIGASQQLGASPTAQQIDALIAVFSSELQLLLQFLNGASNNYRALEGRGRMRGGVAYHYRPATMTGGLNNWEQMSGLAKMAIDHPDTTMALLKMGMSGGAIVPAYNGEGVFGSDGYRIGDFYTYNDPRRFY